MQPASQPLNQSVMLFPSLFVGVYILVWRWLSWWECKEQAPYKDTQFLGRQCCGWVCSCGSLGALEEQWLIRGDVQR